VTIDVGTSGLRPRDIEVRRCANRPPPHWMPDSQQTNSRDLATTVDRVAAEGWVPVYGHVSTTEEWDEYEFSWTGTLSHSTRLLSTASRWALDHPSDPDSATAVETADAHRTQWLRGYRGTLGFITMVLRAAPRALH
jgi:hypothetical protein